MVDSPVIPVSEPKSFSAEPTLPDVTCDIEEIMMRKDTKSNPARISVRAYPVKHITTINIIIRRIIMANLRYHPAAMTTKQASIYLSERDFPVKSSTLEVWRCKKKGPKFKKEMSRVFYEKEWLDSFMEGVPVKIFDPHTGELR